MKQFQHSLLRWYLIAILIGLMQNSSSLIAQENHWYYQEDPLWITANEAYNQGNYALARNQFSALIKKCEAAQLSLDPLRKMEAAYKIAASAKYLENEDASEQLIAFIEKYGTDRYYNSLANYHLATLYYSRKSYSTAISCFEQVHPSDLDKKEYAQYFFYRAYAYFNIKKFDEAYPLFDQVTRMNNAYSADAHYYMGFIAFDREDYRLAENHFNQISDSEKYANIVPYYMSQIYFVEKDYAKVIGYTEPKMKLKDLKYKKETGYILGQSYYRQEKFKEALPYLKAYIEQTAKVRKEDLYQLAYTQYRFEQYDEAIKNFSELNTLQDTLGQNAMYHLADCYLKKNEKQKAQNSFYDASKQSFDKSIQETSHFNYAKLAYELNQDRIALNSLQEFIISWPNSINLKEAKNILADVILTTRNYNEGITIIEGIKDPSEKMKAAYQRMTYYKGLEMLNDNRKTDAEQFFDKANIFPEDREIESLCTYWKGQIAFDRNNYQETEDKMNKFIASNPSNNNLKANKTTALYTNAYCAYYKKDYSRATKLFDQCLDSFNKSIPKEWNNDAQLNRIYSDALMRSADARFLIKDYTGAKKVYEQAIENKVLDADYATYQRGIISGLVNNNQEKVNIMGQLPISYPESLFCDDALFQKAVAHSFLNDFNGAIRTHENILSNYKESVYYRKSLTELGLLHYNQGQYDKSRKYYDQVIREFPESAEAQSAISGLKEVFLSEGNFDGYKSYMRNHPELEMTASKEDSIMYQFAESTFEKLQYKKAIDEFTQYLKEYPKGIFKINAYYYRGESYYQNKQYNEAREDFEMVANKDNNIFYNSAIEKLSAISFYIDKDYNSSYKYYLSSYNRSSGPEDALTALRGLAESAYYLKKYNEVEKYGNKLIDHGQATREDKINANFYLAMSAHRREPAKAKKHFEQLASLTTNEKGAMARYYLAEKLYDDGAYNEARTASLRCDKETPNQEYWVVKSFLLLAQIDQKKGDLVQAKATLKSILDYYNGDKELKNSVQEKYDEIIRQINLQSKLEMPSNDLEPVQELEPEE